jgi:hypothetical protein
MEAGCWLLGSNQLVESSRFCNVQFTKGSTYSSSTLGGVGRLTTVRVLYRRASWSAQLLNGTSTSTVVILYCNVDSLSLERERERCMLPHLVSAEIGIGWGIDRYVLLPVVSV